MCVVRAICFRCVCCLLLWQCFCLCQHATGWEVRLLLRPCLLRSPKATPGRSLRPGKKSHGGFPNRRHTHMIRGIQCLLAFSSRMTLGKCGQLLGKKLAPPDFLGSIWGPKARGPAKAAGFTRHPHIFEKLDVLVSHTQNFAWSRDGPRPLGPRPGLEVWDFSETSEGTSRPRAFF